MNEPLTDLTPHSTIYNTHTHTPGPAPAPTPRAALPLQAHAPRRPHAIGGRSVSQSGDRSLSWVGMINTFRHAVGGRGERGRREGERGGRIPPPPKHTHTPPQPQKTLTTPSQTNTKKTHTNRRACGPAPTPPTHPPPWAGAQPIRGHRLQPARPL